MSAVCEKINLNEILYISKEKGFVIHSSAKGRIRKVVFTALNGNHVFTLKV